MIASNSQVILAMNQNELLIENIDRLHTTPMGVDRIKRNLKLDTDDAVASVRIKREFAGTDIAALHPDTGANTASYTYERNERKIWRTKK